MSSILNDNYIEVTYTDADMNYPRKFCREIAKRYRMRKGQSLLDIGCGDGRFTKAFEELGLEVRGIDFSVSSESLLGDNFTKWDLTEKSYPYPTGQFDYVFSKSVVEHLREPNVLIEEANRLLIPGGSFICMTPSWKHSYREAFYIDHTHVTPFTRHSLETALKLGGFSFVTCNYFYQLPLMWKYPFLGGFRWLLTKLNLPYRPFYRIAWPNVLNKTIRFSKEAMLMCSGRKEI